MAAVTVGRYWRRCVDALLTCLVCCGCCGTAVVPSGLPHVCVATGRVSTYMSTHTNSALAGLVWGMFVWVVLLPCKVHSCGCTAVRLSGFCACGHCIWLCLLGQWQKQLAPALHAAQRAPRLASAAPAVAEEFAASMPMCTCCSSAACEAAHACVQRSD
jgi:hypothetical protein